LAENVVVQRAGSWVVPGPDRLEESALEFRDFRPGVERADVIVDGERGHATAWLRYAPGASVPWHRHPGYEHIWVLRGDQSDDEGTYTAGSVIIHAPGSAHRVWSSSGCLVLAVWERPVEFL
jgi:anti-sigma factor ChrR (cupin superfamily)